MFHLLFFLMESTQQDFVQNERRGKSEGWIITCFIQKMGNYKQKLSFWIAELRNLSSVSARK